MKQLIIVNALIVLSFFFGFYLHTGTIQKNEPIHLKSDSSIVKHKLRYFAIGFHILKTDASYYIGNVGVPLYEMPSISSLQQAISKSVKFQGKVAIISISEMDSTDYVKFFEK